jgi:aryl-alcohol dehydrogenase-like predicted oxidoreductase
MKTENLRDADSVRIDRRRFLQLGVAASGLAIGCGASGEQDEGSTAQTEMRYRPLGNTGLRVSEVSFGTSGFNNPVLLLAALDAGINTVCTDYRVGYGRSEELIGDAISRIGSRREQLVLHTGAIVRPGATKRSLLDSIDASLRRLRTDHVEIYRTSDISSPDDLRVEPLFEAFEEAKRAGKVSHLGLGGHHGGMQDCLNAAIEDGRFEVFFTKYDFVSYPDQDQILSRAAERGIGTIVFKTNAGNRQQEIRDLEAGGLSFRQATVKWALTNPDVASVCVGITNFDQIREYTAAVGSQLNEAEAAMLRRYAREMHDKYCRFCGTCEANCPHDVAIADVMRYAMYFKYYGREKHSMQLYDALPQRRLATMCDRCPGPCDAGCPFGRRVRAELVEAHGLLSMKSA